MNLLPAHVIIPSVVTHLQSVLTEALPHTLHQEILDTFQNAVHPIGGTLSETDANEIIGIHAFWKDDPWLEVSDFSIGLHNPRNGFVEGWLKGAREYCLQSNASDCAIIISLLEMMDRKTEDLGDNRDQINILREATFEQIQQHHQSRSLSAPNAPARFGLSGFIHSLFGWEAGIQLFSAAREPLENIASEEAWIRSLRGMMDAADFDRYSPFFIDTPENREFLFREKKANTTNYIFPTYAEFDDVVSLNTSNLAIWGILTALFAQVIPDYVWTRTHEDEPWALNFGTLCTNGSFRVAQLLDDRRGFAITRLGRSLAKPAISTYKRLYVVVEEVDEGGTLRLKIEKIVGDSSLPKFLTFRVRKPPRSLSRSKSDFWDLISQFIEKNRSLIDTSWGDEVYNLSAMLHFASFCDPESLEILMALEGINLKLNDTSWRLVLLERKSINEQFFYDYALIQEAKEGDDTTVEFVIRRTPLAPGSSKDIGSTLETLLPSLLNMTLPSGSISFGEEGQVLRFR